LLLNNLFIPTIDIFYFNISNRKLANGVIQ